MTAGDLAVALGTLLLAVFAAWSAFEARKAIEQSRELDELNRLRAEYRRSREIRGIARLIHHELVINRDIAEDARKEGHWNVSAGTTHHAWDENAAVMMEELDEDTAAKLVAFFSEVLRWEAHVRYSARTNPQTYQIPLLRGGVPSEIADRMGELAPACLAALHALAYPDGRDVPSDPDEGLAFLRDEYSRRPFRQRVFATRPATAEMMKRRARASEGRLAQDLDPPDAA